MLYEVHLFINILSKRQLYHLLNINFLQLWNVIWYYTKWSSLVTVLALNMYNHCITCITCIQQHLTSLTLLASGCCLVGVCSLLTLTRRYSRPEDRKVRLWLWVWGDSSACPAGHSQLRHETWLNKGSLKKTLFCDQCHKVENPFVTKNNQVSKPFSSHLEHF